MSPTLIKKYPKRKILGIVLLILSVVLLTVNILFLSLIEPILERKIQKIVREESRGLYSIRFNTGQSQILIGKIVLNDVVFTPNPKCLDSLKNLGQEPCRLYEVKIKRVVFYLSNLPQAVFTGHYYLGFFKLEAPAFTIHLMKNHCLNATNPSTRPGIPVNLVTDRAGGRLKSIFINKFLMTLGRIQVQAETPTGMTTAFQSSGITLNADSLRWKNREILVPLKILRNTRFSMILHDSKWQSAQEDYHILAKRMFYSNRDGIMEIQDAQGSKQVNPSHDQHIPDSLPAGISFSIRYASLNQFNWPALLLGESFVVGNIGLLGGDLWVVDEKNPNQKTLHRPLLKGWLEKIRIPVEVNHLNFNQLTISYLERNALTAKSGFLEFFRSEGHLTNIHNQIHPRYDSDWTDLVFNTELYRQGRLNAHLRFNIQSPSQSFELDSKVQNLPLNAINAMSLPISGIKIMGGNLNRLSFSMKADTLKSSGRVYANYKNLRLKFLTHPTEQNPRKVRMMSALANTFLILNDNPLMGEKERFSDFSYVRDPDRSVFHYIWKSLFTGLRPILGIGPQREKSINSFISELREYQKWDQTNQPERAHNKILRKKKRILRRLKKQFPGTLITPY